MKVLSSGPDELQRIRANMGLAVADASALLAEAEGRTVNSASTTWRRMEQAKELSVPQLVRAAGALGWELHLLPCRPEEGCEAPSQSNQSLAP